MGDRAATLLLVCPPWRSPLEGSLALATLAPLLFQAGLRTAQQYSSIYYPPAGNGPPAGPDLPAEVLGLPHGATNRLLLIDQVGAHLFSTCLYPERDAAEAVDGMVRHVLRSINLGGVRRPPVTFDDLGGRDGALWRALDEERSRARVCVDRSVDGASDPRFDLVGFSCTFEAQLPGALAIARAVRERRPDAGILFGGAACYGEAAEGLIESFPFIDVVCHGEGDAVVVPLVRALRSGGPLDGVPGVVYRDGHGRARRTPAPPLCRDMDRLPIPDYDEYLLQLSRSPWDAGSVRLFFELSRGCWWGEKHPCAFCGLTADGPVYRHKTAQRAFEEIGTLYRRHPRADSLWATDNILEPSYLETLMPRLRDELQQDPERPLALFVWTRSNLRREQLRVLSDAGVVGLQPGIESLSDGVLRLMNKGCTALGQVQFLKWASEVAASRPDRLRGQGGTQRPVGYSVLISSPGERPEQYDEMAELLPYLEHLPPPSTVWPIELERFSSYHRDPARHGIRNVRASAYYRDVFPDRAVDTNKLAYRFDFDHPMHEDAGLRRAQGRVVEGFLKWVGAYDRSRACYAAAADGGLVVHERRDGRRGAGRITGLAAEVFGYVDRVRTADALGRRFPGLEADVRRGLLDTWAYRRWAYADPHGRILAVLLRSDPPSIPEPGARRTASADAQGEGRGATP